MPLTKPQRAFLEEVRYAVVGTLNRDRSIQQTMVWFMLEDNDARISIGANSVKARNLRRNPTMTLTVQDGRRYLTISGAAMIEPADPDLRYRLAVRYVGRTRAEEWVLRRPTAKRVTVRIKIQRVYGQGI
ncbi:MAG: PPOX class F420-dependent oxidoreductase [Chloroflexi bacterium AL-W]|nr:PPOX class F420-dependent oxidoreductase [Chloroflexi bacterium AL-N1]NOK70440.1 PPOX class F420-dependent oxidoreductase [Chloroflexi bacterium AL-N10]NOK78201.1 PPOX class F420-dependent oxidoreductase [Chloroflexi bacterium AL-N5]NOK85300.1 PPOX class F420-dependent oxidoreductase [Chloroflexi bacterium AL-W]NOK92065.1 PPOX class F420-dependent oxidoreductase [Chloroflexi bacterium AL-N15]